MWKRWIGVLLGALILAGCAGPDVAIKTTSLGGDRGIRATGKDRVLNLKGINEGDTVIVAPGSQRTVVASSTVQVHLMESIDLSVQQMERDRKRELSVNRKPGARLEFIKGRRIGKSKDFIPFVQVRKDDPSTHEFEVQLYAVNRSEEAFRGDLVIYDWLPSDVELISASEIAKFDDRSFALGALAGAIPVFGLIAAMNIENLPKTDEVLMVQTEALDQIRKYTIKRLVLEPGQWIGLTQKLRYLPPADDELEELRVDTYQRLIRR